MADRKQQNLFHKGLSSDNDYSKRTNDVWEFPSTNIRLLNKKGQGYIITNLPGNTLYDTSVTPPQIINDGEEFKVSEGFSIIGGCEARGRVIIASCSNNDDGTGELGMFPSFNDVTQQWERVYRPFKNFTAGLAPIQANFTDFRTDLFKWDIKHQQRMLSKVSYDDTDDIYFCDYKNFNRVINTGIDSNGQLKKNRIYWNDDFGSKINQILTTNRALKVSIEEDKTKNDYFIKGPGKLKHGNYFLFFKYVTYNYLKTAVIQEFGPCQVFSKGDTIASTIGGPHNKESSNHITIKLEELDGTYDYIEVSFVRYYSDETGVVLHEIKTVADYYDIPKTNGLADTSMTITLTGYETLIEASIADILKQIPNDRICKDQVFMSSRWWGANWKEVNTHYDDMAKFAQKVKLYCDTVELDAKPWQVCQDPTLPDKGVNWSLPKEKGQYKDELNTLKYVGYFRSEAYAFAIQFELDDGTLSDAFPTLGYDCFGYDQDDHSCTEIDYNVNPHKVNNKGIFRFPRARKVPFYYNTGGVDKVRPIGIKFDFNDAIDWLNQNPDSVLHKRVRGVRLLRAERNINLRYQGIMFGVARAFGNISCAKLTYDCTFLPAGDPLLWYTMVAGQGGQHTGSGIDYSVSGQSVGAYQYGQCPRKFLTAFTSTGTNANMFFRVGGETIPEKTVQHTYRNARIPLWRGYAPMHHYRKNSVTDQAATNLCYASRWFLEPGYYAFYSPDHLFNINNHLKDINYIMRVAKTRVGEYNFLFNDYRTIAIDQCSKNTKQGFEGTESMHPLIHFAEMAGGLNWSNPIPDKDIPISGTLSNIGESIFHKYIDSSAIDGSFLNFSSDYYQDTSTCMYYGHKLGDAASKEEIWTARSMIATKYISVLSTEDYYDDPTRNNAADSFLYDIVNLYKINPHKINILNLYSSQTTNYYYIDNNIYSFNHLDEVKSKTAFRGDCFLQRIYFKQMYWNGTMFGNDSKHKGYDVIGMDHGEVDNPKKFSPPKQKTKDSFSHGFIFGMIVESTINSAMRYPGESTTFYPLETDRFNFAKSPHNINGIESLLTNRGYDKTLSIRPFVHYDVNRPVEEEDFIEHLARIRHSLEHDDNSFQDNARVIEANAYKDYSLNDGAIIAIRQIQNNLMSVQERAINRHFTENDKAVLPSSIGELTIGTGFILAKEVQKIVNFGTRHLWSIVNTDRAVYGVDDLMRIIWTVRYEKTDYGHSSLAAYPISYAKEVEKWLYDFFEEKEKRTDNINKYDDTPVYGEGITAGYDRKFDEVSFTFKYFIDKYNTIILEDRPWKPEYYYFEYELITHNGNVYYCNTVHTSTDEFKEEYWTLVDINDIKPFQQGVIPNIGDYFCCCRREGDECYFIIFVGLEGDDAKYCWSYYHEGTFRQTGEDPDEGYFYNTLQSQCETTREYINKTIIYNEAEKADFFVCETDYFPTMYLNINEDFFSVSNSKNKVYLHNREDMPATTFYGTLYNFNISFVVNGIGQEESNAINFIKIFEALEIEASRIPFTKITYQTNFQKSEHIGVIENNPNFWMSAEYLEHKWKIPIFVQTSNPKDDFYQESEMRGAWMKVTLENKTTASMFIKDCITSYRISYQ